jgi:hypothetical protein
VKIDLTGRDNGIAGDRSMLRVDVYLARGQLENNHVDKGEAGW